MRKVLAAAFVAVPARATGLGNCDSGPTSGWEPKIKLEKQLIDQKWRVQRIKVDGGCYEVYGMNGNNVKMLAYFHPVTLEQVPVTGGQAPVKPAERAGGATPAAQGPASTAEPNPRED